MTQEGIKMCKALCTYFTSKDAPIDMIFADMQKHPGITALAGLQAFVSSIQKNSKQKSVDWQTADGLAMQGFVIGMCVGLGSGDPEFLSCIDGFFEMVKKAKGENVINFQMAKAGF
jgi:hypothetical protein